MIKVNNHYIVDEIPDIITELRRQLELNGVKRFYKITDTPHNTMVCCPFHKNGQERKPSMGILKSDGTCHCFACDWVGSLSEMISGCFGYDDMGRYGDKWLVKNFLSAEIEERKDLDLDLTRNKKPKNNQTYVSEEELDKYRYTHPYWAERKITSDWLIDLFDLGYDIESQCITFPNRDKHGNCLFVAKRSVKTKFFNYPEGVEKPLYGLYELSEVTKYMNYNIHIQPYDKSGQLPPISKIDEIIVCESMIDALTCWQYGKYAVALNGLGNNLQFKQLRELPCRKLIIATDNDDAGMKARERIKKNVTNKILAQYMLPTGKKDINDLTLEEFLLLDENFL